MKIRMRILRYFLLSFFFGLAVVSGAAQKRSKAYEEYIHKYRKIAVEEMKRYHVPASITLAQGLLESGAGRSQLARKSNNHFGIKCGRYWEGRTVRADDDAPNECFRAYRHAKESYRDHSKFLRGGSRYASLFKLKITDYKGWARGLKKAGYATDPRYATRLINIIELYGLDRYDKKGGLEWMEKFPDPHQPYLANDLLYVIARKGDTFKSIGKEFGIKKKNVRKYNELPKGYEFQGGEIVYLEEKHKHAVNGFISYVVRPGDSMYSIAQKFGMRLENLYRLNGMDEDDGIPAVGSIVWLQ